MKAANSPSCASLAKMLRSSPSWLLQASHIDTKSCRRGGGAICLEGLPEETSLEEKCLITVILPKMPQQVASNHGHRDTSCCKLHKLHVGFSRKAPPDPCSKKGGKLFKVATRQKYFQCRRIFAIRFFYTSFRLPSTRLVAMYN